MPLSHSPTRGRYIRIVGVTVEQKVKDAVPLIMAKQQLLNDLDNNEEMKELVKIMGKIVVLCRMIVSLFPVYVALMMY